MVIKIETRSESEYEPINKLYGPVLQHFNFHKHGNNALIELNTLEDIDKLNSMLSIYVDDCNCPISDIIYFGLMFHNLYDELILEIKDNFD